MTVTQQTPDTYSIDPKNIISQIKQQRLEAFARLKQLQKVQQILIKKCDILNKRDEKKPALDLAAAGQDPEQIARRYLKILLKIRETVHIKTACNAFLPDAQQSVIDVLQRVISNHIQNLQIEIDAYEQEIQHLQAGAGENDLTESASDSVLSENNTVSLQQLEFMAFSDT